jgi:hypothetical protein
MSVVGELREIVSPAGVAAKPGFNSLVCHRRPTPTTGNADAFFKCAGDSRLVWFPPVGFDAAALINSVKCSECEIAQHAFTRNWVPLPSGHLGPWGQRLNAIPRVNVLCDGHSLSFGRDDYRNGLKRLFCHNVLSCSLINPWASTAESHQTGMQETPHRPCCRHCGDRHSRKTLHTPHPAARSQPPATIHPDSGR